MENENMFSRAKMALDEILYNAGIEPYYYDVVDSKGWNEGDLFLLCDIPLVGDYTDLANLWRDLNVFEYEQNRLKDEYDVTIYKADSDILVKVRQRGGTVRELPEKAKSI